MINDCNETAFYSKHIVAHKPCFIKSESNVVNFKNITKIIQTNQLIKESEEEKDRLSVRHGKATKDLLGLVKDFGIPSIVETLELSKLSIERAHEEYKSGTVLTNKNYLIIQISGTSKLFLSPITQINYLQPYRTDSDLNSHIKFNPIYTKTNLATLDSNNSSSVKLVHKELYEGDIAFIPAYFFTQEIISESESVQLVYEFDSHSKIVDSMFKVLFDDTNLDE